MSAFDDWKNSLPAGQGCSAEDAFNAGMSAGMTRAVDIAKAIAESESEEGNDSYGVGWQIADRILKARKETK